MPPSTLSGKRRLYDRTLRALLLFSAALTCALLAALGGYILFRGLGGLSWSLLTTQTSHLRGTVGILPELLNTLYLVFLTLLLVLPLGVGAAIYLTEYAKSPRLTAAIELAAELLSGIPSILFGLVGMLVFLHFFGLRTGLLAGGLTLVMLLLPSVLRSTQESLKAVPRAYREGALGLGAGKWRMIRTVVLPSAVDGILSGCILAVGRILGESAALLFTAGSNYLLSSFTTALHSSSGTLSVALYLYATERGDLDVAFSIAALLLILTLALGLAARRLGRRFKRRMKGE